MKGKVYVNNLHKLKDEICSVIRETESQLCLNINKNLDKKMHLGGYLVNIV